MKLRLLFSLILCQTQSTVNSQLTNVSPPAVTPTTPSNVAIPPAVTSIANPPTPSDLASAPGAPPSAVAPTSNPPPSPSSNIQSPPTSPPVTSNPGTQQPSSGNSNASPSTGNQAPSISSGSGNSTPSTSGGSHSSSGNNSPPSNPSPSNPSPSPAAQQPDSGGGNSGTVNAPSSAPAAQSPVQSQSNPTVCAISCNGVCCATNQTCNNEICVAPLGSGVTGSTPTTLSNNISDQTSSTVSTGLIVGIIIPVVVVILAFFTFVWYKKRQDRLSNKEILIDTFRHNSLPKEAPASVDTVVAFQSLPPKKEDFPPADSPGSQPRIVEIPAKSMLEPLTASSLTFKELSQQIDNHFSTLISLYSIKAPDRGFKTKSLALGDYGSSFLFHHPGNMHHGIDKVPCGACPLCNIVTNGMDINNTGLGSNLFGQGLYFTMNPILDSQPGKKFVLVCEVLLGNSFFPTTTFPPGPVCLPEGTNSVYALPDVVQPHGVVVAEEFVVYDSSQACPVYLCVIERVDQ